MRNLILLAILPVVVFLYYVVANLDAVLAGIWT